MSVHRCVCYHTSFAQLRPRALAEGWQRVAEISRATGCGSGCGGCIPYLQAMLTTGAVCFRVRQGHETPEPCPPDPWDELDPPPA